MWSEHQKVRDIFSELKDMGGFEHLFEEENIDFDAGKTKNENQRMILDHKSSQEQLNIYDGIKLWRVIWSSILYRMYLKSVILLAKISHLYHFKKQYFFNEIALSQFFSPTFACSFT